MKNSMMSKILSFVLAQKSDVIKADSQTSEDFSKPKSWQEIDDQYKAELLNNDDDDSYEPVLHIDDIVFV